MNYVCLNCSQQYKTAKPLAKPVCPKCKGELKPMAEPEPLPVLPAPTKQGGDTAAEESEEQAAAELRKAAEGGDNLFAEEPEWMKARKGESMTRRDEEAAREAQARAWEAERVAVAERQAGEQREVAERRMREGVCPRCGGEFVPRPRGCLWWGAMILFFPLSLLFLLAEQKRETECEGCGAKGRPIRR